MPQIRPITDLRNTNEISELCHAKKEPIFITKNGYGDLVVMSIETYESLMSISAVPQTEGMCLLTEQSPVWAGVLADVLTQNGIPFVKESSLGAGMALQAGPMLESFRFFVPRAQFDAAKDLSDSLFSGEAEA